MTEERLNAQSLFVNWLLSWLSTKTNYPKCLSIVLMCLRKFLNCRPFLLNFNGKYLENSNRKCFVNTVACSINVYDRKFYDHKLRLSFERNYDRTIVILAKAS